MKLIRLTTESNNAIFDNEFRDNILLKPNSMIALENLSLDTINTIIEINGQNNQINYQITTGYIQNILLESGTFTKDNYNVLLTDLQNKLNKNNLFSNIIPDSDDRRRLGLEWNVSEKNQKINIEYKRGVYADHKSEWKLSQGVENKIVSSRNSYGYFEASGAIGSGNPTWNMLFPNFVSRGNGFIRGRIGNIVDSGGDTLSKQGMTIGLTRVDLGSTTNYEFSLSDMEYGVFVGTDVGSNIVNYRTILNGVISSTYMTYQPNINSPDHTDNDFIEVMLNGDKIELNIYQTITGNEAQPLIEYDYTSGTKLYPFIVFNSGANFSRINNVRLTPSPFNSFTHSTITDGDTAGLQAPSYPPSNQPSNNFLQFVSISLAEFLGFVDNRQPQIGYNDVDTMNYIADVAFEPSDVSDAFLVETLNLKLDSFDGYKSQRKNILAVVPKSNSSGEIIYEPSNLLFIDLNNERELNVRNLRIRVVKNDYTQLNVKGLSSLTLLIKEKGE